MDDSESRGLRSEILEDMAALLREELAGDEWGRVLIEVVRGPDGAPMVAGIDVDEIIGDEARVDAVFGDEKVRAVLPVLAKAVEALSAIDDVDLDQVRGGTFVRIGGTTRFAWLPGLVRAPSARLDRERDDLVARLRDRNDAFYARFGQPSGDRLGIDVAAGTISWTSPSHPPLRARATLIGTFAPAARSWGWGGTNPHLPETVRRASAALVDGVLDRDLWELSTPAFATDEPTVWAIAAFVWDRAKGDAVVCAPEHDGLVFFLVSHAMVD